jgi:hypothetical protein
VSRTFNTHDLPEEFNTVVDEFGEYVIRVIKRHSLGVHFTVAVGNRQVIEMITCFPHVHITRFRNFFEFVMNVEQTRFSIPFFSKEA